MYSKRPVSISLDGTIRLIKLLGSVYRMMNSIESVESLSISLRLTAKHKHYIRMYYGII